MIVSDTLNRSSSPWLQACALLYALVVLPLGLACQRGDTLTDAEELTEEATLKAAETGTAEQVDWRAVKATSPEEWSDELKAQIVAAGYDLEAVAERVRRWQAEQAEWNAIKRRIESAVESGRMTREEADAKYREIRERISQEGKDDGIDWGAVRTTAPEDWSEELKAQLVAAGYDVETLAERVRQGQAGRDAASDLDAIARRIRAAVERGELTPEEGRERMAAARQRQQEGREGDGDRLREVRRAVVERAMATAPEDWSDELKAQIVRAGWDLEEFTEGIRQRQQAAAEEEDKEQE